jgi:hypothetical protein
MPLLPWWLRWVWWQSRQPREQWLSAQDLSDTNVMVTAEGAALFDHVTAFRAEYADCDDPIEIDVHLEVGAHGQVSVVVPPGVPDVPVTVLGVVPAKDAPPVLNKLSALGRGMVARASLVARPTASGYQATVSGYAPDIMRMRSAGYL